MLILDTNVVSELMKPQPADVVRKWLIGLQSERFAITAVTVSEIEYGLQRLPDGSRRRALREFFATLAAGMAILPLDDGAASRAGAFRALREAIGLPASPSDMMIAGIAAQAHAPLATRNIRDFHRLPIELIDPWSIPEIG